MKILIISQYFWPENFPINSIAKSLVDKGHSVDVVTGVPNYPQGFFYEGYSATKNTEQIWEGVKIHRVKIKARGTKGSDLRLIKNYLSYVISGRKYVRNLKEIYDVSFVYAISPLFQAYPALALKRRIGLPMILYVADLWPDTLFAHGFENRLLQVVLIHFCSKIYKKSDYVIATCEGFIPKLIQYGCRKDFIEYIPQWSDQLFNQVTASGLLRSKLAIGPNDFVVMFAGNIGYAQSLDTVMQAAYFLKDEIRIKFVFVGEGTHKRQCEEFVDGNNLHNCYFIGRKMPDDMSAIISESDVMLVTLRDRSNYNLTVPSRVQAFMACGKPLIVSANGETNRLVSWTRTGFVGNAESVGELVNNIRKASSLKKSEMEAIQLNCIECANNLFGMSRVLNRIESVVQKTFRNRGN